MIILFGCKVNHFISFLQTNRTFFISFHQRRLVISSTQTCPRPLSPLWQSAVITLAVAFRLLDRATTDILQSQQSRLRWRISLSAMAVEPECGRILSSTLHPTQIRLNCLIIREFKQCRVELTLHSLNTLYINYLQWICVG